MTAYGSLNDTAVICSKQITFLFLRFAFLLMLLIFYPRFLSYLCYMCWNYKPSCSAAQIAFTEISFPIISVCLSLLWLPRFERKQNTNCVSAFACSLQLTVCLALRCYCLYVLLLLPASVSVYNMYFIVFPACLSLKNFLMMGCVHFLLWVDKNQKQRMVAYGK